MSKGVGVGGNAREAINVMFTLGTWYLVGCWVQCKAW